MMLKEKVSLCDESFGLSVNNPQVIINKYKVIVAKKKLLQSSVELLLQDCEGLLKDIRKILSDEKFQDDRIMKISEEIVDFIELLSKGISSKNHSSEIKFDDKIKLLDNLMLSKENFKVCD